jgi:hypothetical protein
MRNVLTGSKIDDKRIFIENNAISTKENLNFPDELYNLSNKNIIIKIFSDIAVYPHVAGYGRFFRELTENLDKENPRGVKCNST